MQHKFSIRVLAAGLILLGSVLLTHRWLVSFPNREEFGWRSAEVEFRAVPLDGPAFAPLRLAGAWKLTSNDPRFGGISALAIDRGRLLALTDSGLLIRFRPGSGRALIGEPPDGPGSRGFKRNRDSEALLRDPGRRGWCVTFENYHQLGLYEDDFGRALERISLGNRGWPANRGVEGVAAEGDSLLLLPEAGDSLLRITGRKARALSIAHARGRISDVAAIARGAIPGCRAPADPLGVQECAGGAGEGGFRLSLRPPHLAAAEPDRQCRSDRSRAPARRIAAAMADDRR
ncbi:MAG: esterase-like activity of phytase family protein [Sphingomicrobium sp.]